MGVIASEISTRIDRDQRQNNYFASQSFNLNLFKPLQWTIKRSFDVCSSLMFISMFWHVFLIIALAIKLESKGPVFFKQERVGLCGKKFYMYKFRSMVQDAEAQLHKIKDLNQTNDKMFKMTDDPRMTKVGKFLRKFSIDEFAQLINVIKGEMSLVGPRPPLQREIDTYEKWHYIKFATLPGLTGMWQTSGRSDITNFDEVIALDYSYITNWSFWLDIKLILKTIPVVLAGKGAA